MPQACPHLAVPFAGERRRFQDAPNVVYQLVIPTGPNGSPAGARRRGRMPLPVERGAGHAPHAADARQAIRLGSGGRAGLAHRLDLLCGKGRLSSSRPIFSRNSSMSIVASPSFSRRRPISQSRLSSGCFFSASWPAARNASRQVARRAAGSPSSRDRRSSASPRSRRNTTSVFCRAENRSGFFPPLLLPSPVALRAPCEGTSMEISCACIWTPPVSDYTQCGVQSNCTPNQILAWERKFRDLHQVLFLYALGPEFLALVIEGDEAYTKVQKNVPPDQSSGWTILLMDRASRFIWELDCGKKERKLFRQAITSLD